MNLWIDTNMILTWCRHDGMLCRHDSGAKHTQCWHDVDMAWCWPDVMQTQCRLETGTIPTQCRHDADKMQAQYIDDADVMQKWCRIQMDLKIINHLESDTWENDDSRYNINSFGWPDHGTKTVCIDAIWRSGSILLCLSHINVTTRIGRWAVETGEWRYVRHMYMYMDVWRYTYAIKAVVSMVGW